MRLRLIVAFVLATLIAESGLADQNAFDSTPPSPGATPPTTITTTPASPPNAPSPVFNRPSTTLSTPTSASQVATPFSLSNLPDDIAQRLRDSLSTHESPARAALRQKLDALQAELEPAQDGATDAQRATGNGAQRQRPLPMQARSATPHRVEVQQLRDQTLVELNDLQEKVRVVAGDARAAAVAQLAAQVTKRFERLDGALQRLENSRDEGQAGGARDSLSALLHTLHPAAEALPAGPVPTLSPMRPLLRPPGQGIPSRKLPQYAMDSIHARGQGLAGVGGFGLIKASLSLPPVAADTATDCSAVAADLADDGAEVRLTPEIQTLAQSLQYSPVRILKWMQKEVAFKPYWGSLKGALGVLQTREGNATDQSSLLIALLRASNVPARFVRGTVALYDMQPSDNATGKAQRWLGTKNYSASLAYLTNSGGIPGGPYSIDGIVQGISFDHVWVQACVPFAAYRGNAADVGGYRWVPLDPSVKDHDYQAGIAVNVQLDASFYATYLATRRDQLPPEYLADKVELAARAIKSDASVQDVPYRGTLRALRLDVLPSATPYAVVQFTNWPGTSSSEGATIAEAHRHKFSVTVKNAVGTVLTTNSVSFPQSVFKRLTVSYAPDSASQSLWNVWGGTLAALPSGSVNVYPQIKLEGTVIADGSSSPLMALGAMHSLTMKLTQGEETEGQCINDDGNPVSAKDSDISCLNKTVYTTVKAGAYYALGVNANQTSDAFLEGRAGVLAAGVHNNPLAPTPASGSAYDATVGELLHLVLQTYIKQIDDADKRIAELRGFRTECVNDFATPGFINLRCRVVLFQSASFALAVG